MAGAVVVFTLGLAAGRATGPAETGTAPSLPSEAALHPPTAETEGATSPSVRQEPTFESRPSDPAGGWPAAYPQTPEGAVAAATDYLLALDGPAFLDEQRRARLLEVIAARQAHDELAATFRRGAVVVAGQLDMPQVGTSEDRLVWRAIPAGWQVRAYNGRQATVAVWAVGILLTEEWRPPRPVWTTTEFRLVFEDGGWRLLGLDSHDGPIPAGVVGPDLGPLARAVNAFHRFRHWPAPTGR